MTKIAWNTFVLLHSPRKHQKDPKVHFFVLTIWKFQNFFVSLQYQSRHTATPVFAQKWPSRHSRRVARAYFCTKKSIVLHQTEHSSTPNGYTAQYPRSIALHQTEHSSTPGKRPYLQSLRNSPSLKQKKNNTRKVCALLFFRYLCNRSLYTNNY